MHHTAIAGRPGAGPALALSLVLVAIVCGFTGLCYAEMASMIPIAGIAYTYTYATMGELVAWIIGWDLILEYAFCNMSVSVGFAAHIGRHDGLVRHSPGAASGSRPHTCPAGCRIQWSQPSKARLALRLQLPAFLIVSAADGDSGAVSGKLKTHKDHGAPLKIAPLLA